MMVDKKDKKGAVEAFDHLVGQAHGVDVPISRRPCGFVALTGLCNKPHGAICLNCSGRAAMTPPGSQTVAVPDGAVAKVKAACSPRLQQRITAV